MVEGEEAGVDSHDSTMTSFVECWHEVYRPHHRSVSRDLFAERIS